MYDVLIVGAGPGGIFTAYELIERNPNLKIVVFEMGHALEQRHCPIDGEKSMPRTAKNTNLPKEDP